MVLDCIFFLPRVTVRFFFISARLGFRLCSFLSLLAPFPVFCFFSWLLGKSRLPLGHRGKCPVVPCQLGASARFDIALFNFVEDYQQYKQKSTQRKVVPGRNINFSQLQHFKFEGLFSRMGWLPMVTISEPIFPTLV